MIRILHKNYLTEGCQTLKKRNDKQEYPDQAELYDLQADIGGMAIQIADNRYQEKIYLSARVQEVQNHYTVVGEDTGKLANYTLMESKKTQDVDAIMKELQGKIGSCGSQRSKLSGWRIRDRTTRRRMELRASICRVGKISLD